MDACHGRRQNKIQRVADFGIDVYEDRKLDRVSYFIFSNKKYRHEINSAKNLLLAEVPVQLFKYINIKRNTDI